MTVKIGSFINAQGETVDVYLVTSCISTAGLQVLNMQVGNYRFQVDVLKSATIAEKIAAVKQAYLVERLNELQEVKVPIYVPIRIRALVESYIASLG